jgi:hypothetical protein
MGTILIIVGGTIMVTEEQIRQLAQSIWEHEGRPLGKDLEHYFRAKKILEERELSQTIESVSQNKIRSLNTVRDENEIKLKRAYWSGVFDALKPAEKSRSEKSEKDKMTAGIWIAALDWMLGQETTSTVEKEENTKS